VVQSESDRSLDGLENNENVTCLRPFSGEVDAVESDNRTANEKDAESKHYYQCTPDTRSKKRPQPSRIPFEPLKVTVVDVVAGFQESTA
jgi:hypothetical protein